MRNALLIVVLWCVPSASYAAVTINEVAWMGSVNSPNDEWIELYNDSGAVDVTGWILTDGNALSIALSGTLAAGAYAVLERTDDTSAPGTAFLVYTGALANTGATLTLYRADGGIEDQVAGGPDWQDIGGDNTTKDTAQYTSSGWVTAVPTPGSVNHTVSTPIQNSDTATKTAGAVSSGRVGISIPVQKKQLFLEPRTPEIVISGPELGYVNQPVTFSSVASGLAAPLLDSLVQTWNFGDGSTATGKTALHQYRYPGTYAVVVSAAYKDYEAKARHQVTVLPTTLTLTINERGDVQLSNAAKYEVDVSHYLVRSLHAVSLPTHTILLPNSTITLPREQIGYQSGGSVVVLDAAGETVAVYPMVTPYEPVIHAVATEPVHAALIPVAFTEPVGEGFGFDSDVPTPTLSVAEDEPPASLGSPAALALEAAPVSAAPLYPYLGLAALIAIGLLGVIARSTGSSTAPVIPSQRPTAPFFDERV